MVAVVAPKSKTAVVVIVIVFDPARKIKFEVILPGAAPILDNAAVPEAPVMVTVCPAKRKPVAVVLNVRFPLIIRLLDAKVRVWLLPTSVILRMVVAWLRVRVLLPPGVFIVPPAQFGVLALLSVSVQLPLTLKVADDHVIVAADVVIVPVL